MHGTDRSDGAALAEARWQYRLRRMRVGDVPVMARMWAGMQAMPAALEQALPDVLQQMVRGQYLVGVVTERLRAPGQPWEIAAMGLGCFLADGVMERFRQRPFPFLSLSVLDRVRQGRAEEVMLDFAEVARRQKAPPANLDYCILCWLQDNYDPRHADTRNLFLSGMRAVERYISGYRLRTLMLEGRTINRDAFEFVGFSELIDLTDAPLPEGFEEVRDDPRYMPYLVGIHTAEASWRRLWLDPLSRLFNFSEPVMGLTDKQKVVLDLALEGYPDRAIARILGIRSNAVHMRWRGIYDKAQAILPELANAGEGEGEKGRGWEKRRLVLEYIRDHPQEIRPWIQIPAHE